MDKDSIVRQHLVNLLEGRQAHLNFADILEGIPLSLQGRRPEGSPYSPWQLLEHLRIAQWDILQFSRDPHHVSPEFPKGYWPDSECPPDETDWESSIASFRTDLQAMKQLVLDSSTDLYAKIPHGSGQTILREALLIADHNAYHLGQIILLRRLLACAPDAHLG